MVCCQPLQPRLRRNCKSPAIENRTPKLGSPFARVGIFPSGQLGCLRWKKGRFRMGLLKPAKEKHAWQSHSSLIDWKWVFFPVSYLFLAGQAFKTCFSSSSAFANLYLFKMHVINSQKQWMRVCVDVSSTPAVFIYPYSAAGWQNRQIHIHAVSEAFDFSPGCILLQTLLLKTFLAPA